MTGMESLEAMPFLALCADSDVPLVSVHPLQETLGLKDMQHSHAAAKKSANAIAAEEMRVAKSDTWHSCSAGIFDLITFLT